MNLKPIQIEAYNPDWPDKFAAICHRLRQHLGEMIGDIHHVGSTAVPGLRAKPIIDIDIILTDLSQLEQAIAILDQAGYRYQGEMGITGRHAFSYQFQEEHASHNLYICDPESEAFKNHICLRDFLRNNEAEKLEYGALKVQLANLHPYDLDRYVDGKTAFITGILERSGFAAQAIRLIRKENIF